MLSETKSVEILLATYNGEKYLRELLRSLLEQTYSSFKILVRDDGSKDNTIEILKEFVKNYPDKIRLIEDQQNLGVIGNFSELLKNSQATYLLFSDQDDWWLPNKVEISLKAIQNLENQYGVDTPLLVHTDLVVVDKDLKTIDSSFCNFVKINPNFTQLNRLLIQNCVTGCTMTMNRALVNKCLPIPQAVMMHDWWIALVASCFGRTHFIPDATILYRQHSANVLGAMRPSLLKLVPKFFKKKTRSFGTKNQAEALLDAYSHELDPAQKKMIEAFCTINNQSFLKQRMTILRNGFFMHRRLYNFIRFFLRKFRY